MEGEPQRPYHHDISHQFQQIGGKNLGSFGCFNAGVYVVRSKANGKKYVEKKFKSEDIFNGGAKFEMHCLRKLWHKNIVKYAAGFIVDKPSQGPPAASVYLEYCDMGNLHDYVQPVAQSGGFIDEVWIWDIFVQLVDAVAYLQFGIPDACHNPEPPREWIGIIHRDIKLDNIFLCSRPNTDRVRICLGDFGLAIREDDSGAWGRHYMGGNEQTSPPEVDLGGFSQYSMAGDVWAVGCCISLICLPLEDPKRRRFAGPAYTSRLNKTIALLMHIDPHQRSNIHVFARNLLARRDDALWSLESGQHPQYFQPQYY